VNPGRNTSKITPVAHPRVDPYDLHHITGHEPDSEVRLFTSYQSM
jgi:hypothetical protein